MTGTQMAKDDYHARAQLEAALLRGRAPAAGPRGGPQAGPGTDSRSGAQDPRTGTGSPARAADQAAHPLPPSRAAADGSLAGPDGATRFRASLAQEGMWRSLRGGPGSTPPLLTGGLRLRGPLGTGALEDAWNDVVARHDNLRSTLRQEDGRLNQVVAGSLRLPVPVTGLAIEDFGRFTRQEVDRPLDLAEGPLAGLRLLRLGADDHIAFLLVHHIIGDGRTLEVLVRDLSAFYLARTTGTTVPLPRLPVRYGEFAAAHRARTEGPRGAEVGDYWLRRLAGAEPAELPTDRAPSGRPAALGGFLDVPMPADVLRRLTEFARARRTTLHTVGLAAFQALLARESGQRDISVRVPVSYRDGTELQDLVADFSNDVVVRTDLSANPAFGELVDRVHHDTALDFAHHDLPPHLLEPRMDTPGLLDRLFHVQFTAEREFDVAVTVGELRAEPIMPPDPYVSRPLSLRLRHGDGSARCLAAFALDRFSEERVARFVADYHDLVGELTGHPDRRVLG
ncbi:condensation domain-containing protein [Streptomyces fructofermentans]|uniref:condensation domain-containing protein n=1 Tax=Streptomyces fructofermentans TaxID=152141 RepID=UPI0033FDEF26